MTLEEYFVFEEASATRHEFMHGQVHAMSGVTRRHSRITMNIAAQVWIAARGGPCGVHRGEVKVQTNGVTYYPDVMTACGAEPRDLRVEDAPAVVVDVLSPSTERIDCGEKLLVYREIPSLRAYLIVDRDRRLVEHYWRKRRRTAERRGAQGVTTSAIDPNSVPSTARNSRRIGPAARGVISTSIV